MPNFIVFSSGFTSENLCSLSSPVESYQNEFPVYFELVYAIRGDGHVTGHKFSAGSQLSGKFKIRPYD